MATDVTTPPETVTVLIDGQEYKFPKGQNLLEACQQVGAKIPFFCYHPGLSSPAVCRQCLVEVKGQPKPVPSCYLTVADKMEVTTNSPKVVDVRRQMLEFTLLNHPIDCPICDKAGECSLQKHYFDWNTKPARNEGIKVRKAKVVDIGKHIILDQERCILCSRCIRVCNEVAKSPDLTMAYRGSHEVLTTAPGQRLDNPYSLNTVDVCPVGALTSKDFRFSSRAWELQSTPSICPGCATGCSIEVHATRGKIVRLVPRHNPKVNQYWMCDEGRFEYKAVHEPRHLLPRIRNTRATVDQAVAEAARLLQSAEGKVAVVLSANATNEDLHAGLRFALETLNGQIVFGAEKPSGQGDAILRSSDKNANATGLRSIAGEKLRPVSDLAKSVAGGQVKVVVVVGDAELPALEVPMIALVAKQGTAVDQAQVILPIRMWAEVQATLTNKLGHVQRLHATIEPTGETLPGWSILSSLTEKMGKPLGFGSAAAVFADAAARYAFLKDTTFGEDQAPTTLRFGDSRG